MRIKQKQGDLSCTEIRATSNFREGRRVGACLLLSGGEMMWQAAHQR